MIRSWGELAGRIAAARSSAGFTQGDLASKVGVDRTAVTKIEKGDRQVNSLELARIADALARPIQWFLMSPSRTVISRRNAREGVEKHADVVLELLAADVEQLREMGLLRPTNHEGLGPTVDSVEGAEQAARLARDLLGSPAEPLLDLVRRVEELGLYAFVLDVESNVEGSYLSLAGGGGVALVQGRDPSGKRRFTLAHELGHHMLQDEYSTEWITGGKDERERLISAFAIHFLLPRAGVGARWRELDGATDPRNAAIHVAAEHAVSWSALCSQLANLELVTKDERARLAAAPPSGLDFLERKLQIHDVPAAPAVPPGFMAAVASGYRRQLLGRQRALEMLRGAVEDSALPEQHEVPLEDLIGDLDPS
ncbi:MAG: helix-turn-helix domain-containing protein [Deltaproteobacteria bacterium]|nr:helix-turn-helix domain-containing protein [Deltaproteobacteria bacterium]